LRQQVETLLRAHEQAGDFLGQTVKLAEPDFALEKTGMMIGRYKLLEKIGEGGFGVVYMAEQTEPVQRKVALKIIKAGMDTREVVARFEAERQALALMDHPNITRVLDAGATEAGRPYFVMELVCGIPITDYCDRSKLPTRERLQLFMKVCHAVQHAHQKGIIHRDIKPNNVLVTLHDGAPVPKVIDFGIAKALGQKLTEKTLFTGFAHMIGTPAYMSPEQAELSGLDIDTRADIYSLGVLLYELLTGVTPFDRETLAKAALDEIRRMIREIEPLKPSTRLQTLGDKLTEVAKHRQAAPAELNRLVRGDLDWVVMKSLEKDRQRRYETANALAMDVQRHLNNEPVLACPPSHFYRFRKTVRRHKFTVFAGFTIVTSLMIGLGVSAFLLVKEREARQHVVTAEQEERRLAIQLGDVVDRLLNGRLNDAETVLRAALPTHKKVFGEESFEVAGWLAEFADLLQRNGKFSEAELRIRESLAILEKRFPGHWGVFHVQIELGGILLNEKKYAEAEPLLLSIQERMMRGEDRILPPDSQTPKQATERLVQLYTAWDKTEKAAEWQQKLNSITDTK
jgi:serine/threonine protein kinase